MRKHSYTKSSSIQSAFTLIEVVIAIVVLAIAVPPTLNLMDSAASGRVDAIQTTRATFLSTIVLESVLADMTSSVDTLGFEALTDSDTYLNTPTTGLYARLESITQPYQSFGITYTLEIGSLVASDGLVSDDDEENVFRTITVFVLIPSASTASTIMPVSLTVSEM